MATKEWSAYIQASVFKTTIPTQRLGEVKDKWMILRKKKIQ